MRLARTDSLWGGGLLASLLLPALTVGRTHREEALLGIIPKAIVLALSFSSPRRAGRNANRSEGQDPAIRKGLQERPDIIITSSDVIYGFSEVEE